MHGYGLSDPYNTYSRLDLLSDFIHRRNRHDYHELPDEGQPML
jgi:hypothetical protein